MNDIAEAPTINEILFNRKDKMEVSPYSIRPTRYYKGEMVVFKFGSVIRRGRITTEEHYNGMSRYHIEAANGVWFRGINEDEIISKES